MPFLEKSNLSLKKEFMAQIANGELSLSELCRRFEISRPTGYKWQRRFVDEGTGGLDEKSRKPHESPARTRSEIESAVLEVRDENPMDLLQMDFKGHIPMRSGKGRLTEAFRRYGLPDSINTDNGPPWASPGAHGQITHLGLWLIRLGIRLSRSREFHPQTNGKVERFHRTLKAEVLQARSFTDFDECQSAFDEWRYVYNFERPHQALDLETPSEQFQMSSRRFPEVLPEIVYGPDDQVRKVQDGGIISFRGVHYRVGRALRGLPVAVRPTAVDGGFDV